EADSRQGSVRVLARLRDMAAPPPEDRWDDRVAAEHIEAGEIESVVDAYSGAFISRMPPVADADSPRERLARRGFALAILSTWLLALTIDRFAEAHDWP